MDDRFTRYPTSVPSDRVLGVETLEYRQAWNLVRVLAENVAVARAHGIALDADSETERLAFLDNLPAAMTSSMAGDLARGNRLELDWLSGAVVRMGREA